MSTAILEAYNRLTLAILALDSRDQDSADEHIRDAMDILWNKMSPAERTASGEFAELHK